MNAFAIAAHRPSFGSLLGDIIHAAVTHVTALRNYMADAVDAYIKSTGSANADGTLRIRASTTTLVDFPFTDGFGAASSGVITLQDVPIEVTAVADGTADNAQILDRGEAVAISCSVTATGMGGDIEVSNTSIATGQDCSLDSLTYESPA